MNNDSNKPFKSHAEQKHERRCADKLSKSLQIEVMWAAREYMKSDRNPEWVLKDSHELLVERSENATIGIKRIWFDVLSNEFFAARRKQTKNRSK